MTTLFSQIRQNFHIDCEAALNKFANLELHISYVYLSMAYHFDRDDVAMDGFRKFCLEQSHKEYELAEKILAYQNLRGGRIVLLDIQKPGAVSWEGGLAAMQAALELEKKSNQAALDLHRLAGQKGDAQTSDWIEQHFLDQKVESMKKIGEHVTNLKKVGEGHGEYLFERETLTEENK